MKLITGLGNPGPEYDGSRHNVGFEVLDAIARRAAPGEIARARFHGAVIEGRTEEGDKLVLLKPTTYMNRAGLSVREAVSFYKLDPAADLLVIVDDLALPCGAIRLRPAGGSGGHNGLIDIERRLGDDTWARLRIGIDPAGEIPGRSYVLGRFRPDQRELVEPAITRAAEAALVWAREGLETAMNRYNQRQSA